jgi:LacI family transcriptional regulator
MKFEAITIKDIAKALGLSTSTVSRALRDSYEISAETKQMVLKCAEELNYRPNPIAQSLKEKKTQSIGVVVCEIANSFFSQVINGIESIAYDRGYNVIISQTHESYEREISDLRFLASRSVDGLLISVSTETQDIGHLKQLHDKGFPIVFFDRIRDEFETHKVIVDNHKGAYDAVSHLIQNGITRIAAIVNAESLSITKERLAGYKKALQDNGIELDSDLIKYCPHGGMIYAEVEKAVVELIDLKPEAIFTAADKLTTGCLKTLKSKNINVPDEIALIGFSNTELADLINPPLSLIKQPAFEMGQVATEFLLKLIESKKPVTEFEKRILIPELQIRQSSELIKILSKSLL